MCWYETVYLDFVSPCKSRELTKLYVPMYVSFHYNACFFSSIFSGCFEVDCSKPEVLNPLLSAYSSCLSYLHQATCMLVIWPLSYVTCTCACVYIYNQFIHSVIEIGRLIYVHIHAHVCVHVSSKLVGLYTYIYMHMYVYMCLVSW